ncbi:MAG: hypothetical protein Q8N53_13115 [Longimicrobiales bacterium]|nr:hypothetical protein [Longimicrobiales bacterium]
MRWIASLRFGVAMVVAASLAGCAADTELTGPDVAPQFAKPGGGAGTAATLEQYWVYTDAQGVDQVHMVVANATRITKGVVHDFFFNALQDDNSPYDQHYEWHDIGGKTPAPDDLGNGRVHVDLPFRGGRGVNDTTGVEYLFTDFLSTSVGGSGKDPFVFDVYAYRGDQRVGTWHPTGVIIAGQTQGAEGVASPVVWAGHGSPLQDQVRSYATFKGATASGQAWITTLQLAGVQCRAGTIRKGKTTSTTNVVVSGDVTIAFAGTAGSRPPLWWEGHFRDPATGALSARIAQQDYPNGTYALSAAMPAGWTGSSVEFVIDFVRTTGRDGSEFMDYTYDPGANMVPTTAGVGVGAGDWSNAAASSVLRDNRFPVAHSGSMLCGG